MGVVLMLALSITSILHDGEWTTGDQYVAQAGDRTIVIQEFTCWWKAKVVVAVMGPEDTLTTLEGSVWPTGARWRRAAIERMPKGTHAQAAELGWPWPIATSYETKQGIIQPGPPVWNDLNTVRIGSLQFEYPAHVYLPGLLGWIVILGTPAWAVLAAFNWSVATICRRRRITRDQCISCGYPMRGIDASRCPECGAAPSIPSRREIAPAPRETVPK
ncbi:MAG: hypothetical protein U0638_08800 [Phycisphaerales bacterium]